MNDALFSERDGAYVPSEHTRGPWDPDAMHAGAVAALLVDAFERDEDRTGLNFARLSFEILRPVPIAPLELALATLRPGRRVVELGAELHAEGQLVCRAGALCVAPVPEGLPVAAVPEREPLPGPAEGSAVEFELSAGEPAPASFPRSMEMRWLDDPTSPGPARVWMRPRRELLAGRPLSPLARAVATADFANGIAAPLPFEGYLFINADLTLRLLREPRGEWIGVDARTHAPAGGGGLTESVVWDESGLVGFAFQALVIGHR